MNQTGLSQSMEPTIHSVFLGKDMYKDSCVKSSHVTLPCFQTYLHNSGIPLIFDICPLLSQATEFKPPKGTTIPCCSVCSSFPNQKSIEEQTQWKCGVCGSSNSLSNGYVVPKYDEYDIVYECDKKPVFVFIIQQTEVFTNERVLNSIFSSINSWANNNPESYSSVVFIGNGISYYILSKPLLVTHFESEPETIPKFLNKNSRFQVCYRQMNSAKPDNFIANLESVITSFKSRRLCCILFAEFIDVNETPNSSKLFSNQVSFHLFTTKSYIPLWFIRLMYRIRVFDNEELCLIGETLAQFLKSGFMFNVFYSFCLPKGFSFDSLICKEIKQASKGSLFFIDGQSSISAQVKMNSSISSPITTFQISLGFLSPQGTRIMRVINWTLKVSESINIDGVIYGCYIARNTAHRLFQDDFLTVLSALRNDIIQTISNWSESGYYHRQISTQYRDIPILLYSICNSNMFSEPMINLRFVNCINYLSMSPSRVLRSLYPSLIIPPMKFPHRLSSHTIRSFRDITILKEFFGYSLTDNIPYTDLPVMKTSNPEKILHFCNDIKFTQFCENIECEVNGKRF